MFVTKVRTIIVPSIEVQTKNPAVHLISTIHKRQISKESTTPHRMNHQEADKSAMILSPKDLRPKALLKAATAFSKVCREISPVGLFEKTTPVLELGIFPVEFPSPEFANDGRHRPMIDNENHITNAYAKIPRISVLCTHHGGQYLRSIS